MKYLFFALSSIFFVKINAQCIVDAGPNKIICLDPQTLFVDTPMLLANVSNVINPYQITWTTKIETGLISFPYIYASDILSDTNILNPLLHTHIYNENNTPILFKIEVIDSLGNTCKDSIEVKFSKFAITMVDNIIYQKAGDTAQISATVQGGIPPLKYSWFPKENIDTITNNSCCPLVWPLNDVTYSALATDSIGCSVGANPSWSFTITTSINNLTENNLIIYPNPTKEILNFSFETKIEDFTIRLSNSLGKIVLSQEIINNQIDLSYLSEGIYHFEIISKNKLISTGNIIKE